MSYHAVGIRPAGLVRGGGELAGLICQQILIQGSTGIWSLAPWMKLTRLQPATQWCEYGPKPHNYIWKGQKQSCR